MNSSGIVVDAANSRGASASTARPLRIGILLDSLVPGAWVERLLARIAAEGIGELTIVVLNDTSSRQEPQKRRGMLERVATWYRNRDLLAYTLYARFDERRYGSPDHPGTPADLSALVQNVPIIRVHPRMTRFCDYFNETDVKRIHEAELDVALRFGFRILKGDALRIARHGVWSFHHGDNTVNRGGPAGFWEVAEQHDVTGTVLQRLTEELDGGEVLGRVYASSNRFSPTANRANYYWQAVELMVAKLRELKDFTTSCDREVPCPEPGVPARLWSSYSNRLYVRPGIGETLALLARLSARLIRSKIRSLVVREQWLIAYRLAPHPGKAGDVPDGVFYRFRELNPPPDRFWADPFPVSVGDKHFLFFEEHIHGAPHAHICVLEVAATGAGAPRIVLQRPYHLSYPSVFRWNDEWYMTPETAKRRAVELYRAESFPDKWTFVGDLLADIDAVDPTIACIAGRWWMFLAVNVSGAMEATALHIYSAPNPLGPWTPHRRNPVKIDVRGARPGGRVFEMDGRYYRVGQDGAPRYGSGLRVFVIDELDDDRFRETEVSRILPRWRTGLVGAHTLNASGGLTAIDARQVRYRF